MEKNMRKEIDDFFLPCMLNLVSCFPFLGASQNKKAGTDALLDLLSIGSPSAANSSPASDILSLNLENKSSGTAIDGLSSLSSIPTQMSSPSKAAPVVDLLDVQV